MIISTFSKKRTPRKPRLRKSTKLGRARKFILGSTKSGLATRAGVAISAVGGIALARKLKKKPLVSPLSDPTQNTNPVYKTAKATANQATQGAIDGSIEGARTSANKIVLQPLKQTYKKVRQRGYTPEAKVRAIARKTGVAYQTLRTKGRKAEAKVVGVYGKLRAIGRQAEAKVYQQYRDLRAAGKKAERKVLRSRKSR